MFCSLSTNKRTLDLSYTLSTIMNSKWIDLHGRHYIILTNRRKVSGGYSRRKTRCSKPSFENVI